MSFTGNEHVRGYSELPVDSKTMKKMYIILYFKLCTYNFAFLSSKTYEMESLLLYCYMKEIDLSCSIDEQKMHQM